MAKKTANPLLTIFLIIVGAGIVFFALQQPVVEQRVDSFQKSTGLFLSSQQEFEQAIENTANTESAHVDYSSDVTIRVTDLPSGLSAIQEAQLAGFITGDDDQNHQVLRISSSANPGLEIAIEVIGDGIDSDQETWYLKGPATGQQWLKMSEEEYFEEGENEQPVDASLFAFLMISSILDVEDGGLLSSIDPTTIEFIGEETKDNKLFKTFRVEISNEQFIDSISGSEYYTESEIDDVKEILASAVLSAEMTVDTKSNYISSMMLEADNLTQIIPEQAQGVITQTNDITMNAKFSRYELPIEVDIPDESEVISSDNVLGVSTSINFEMLE